MKEEEINEMRRQLRRINEWINQDVFSVPGQESDSIIGAPHEDLNSNGGRNTEKACSVPVTVNLFFKTCLLISKCIMHAQIGEYSRSLSVELTSSEKSLRPQEVFEEAVCGEKIMEETSLHRWNRLKSILQRHLNNPADA